MRMERNGRAARFLTEVQSKEAPAHGLQTVLQSPDEKERRDDDGDWVEEVGRNLFFNSPVKGRARYEGDGIENNCSIPSSTSSQTPLQRPVEAEALGEGGDGAKERRQARRGGFRGHITDAWSSGLASTCTYGLFPALSACRGPLFSGSQPSHGPASTQRCSTQPPACKPFWLAGFPPVQWRALP